MKKILTYLFLFLILSSTLNFSFAKEREIKVRIYGYTYNENKNNPIKDLSVYIKKDGVILGTSKSNKEGLFDLVIDNRSDYLNLCIESNSFTEIQNINYCVTISAFQQKGRVIDDIEIREVKYDFYTNNSGENLNQRYEDEITNKKTEEAFSEYQEIINQQKEEEATKIAEELKQAELDKLKSDYKMVANTEMTGPLEAIQIIGTIKTESGTTNDFDYNRTYIIVVDHFGNKLKEERLNKYYDFNITVTPKGDKVFLHPVNLKIENREYIKIDGENIQKYQSEYRLIYKEKNIINIELKENKLKEADKKIYINRDIPIYSIIIILVLFFTGLILIVKNRMYIRKNDY